VAEAGDAVFSLAAGAVGAVGSAANATGAAASPRASSAVNKRSRERGTGESFIVRRGRMGGCYRIKPRKLCSDFFRHGTPRETAANKREKARITLGDRRVKIAAINRATSRRKGNESINVNIYVHTYFIKPMKHQTRPKKFHFYL
jgi:hypothetical protein